MTSVWDKLERHLISVQSPSQYIGGEWNSVRKEDAEVKVALAFHDCYKIGMAHLGIHLLYGLLNERPDALCERVFAPWPDLEDRMRRDGIPLFSLDSHRPVREFDIPPGLNARNKGCWNQNAPLHRKPGSKHGSRRLRKPGPG